jgi:hypothetical protein
MNSSVDLSTYLSTSGTGAYSSIVSVYTSGTDPLTSAQNDLISAYQQFYGVKWAIVGATSTSGLSGVTGGSLISTEVCYFFPYLFPYFFPSLFLSFLISFLPYFFRISFLC